MPLLLWGTAVYFVAGTLFIWVFRDDPAPLIGEILRDLPGSMGFFLEIGWWVVPLFAGLAFVVPPRELAARLPRAAVAIFACTAFFLVFTMMKTALPFALPFWADPYLARIDRVLHFGADPWALVHAVKLPVSPDAADRLYLAAWLVPAMYLPVLLMLFDGDGGRIRRFTWLYFFAWIGIGNGLALAFLSAGPVYYDRLFGGSDFAGLTAALARSGVSASSVGRTADKLWQAYETGAQDTGSGISAFPSVHIAMVAVFALYMWERHRYFALPGVLLVAAFIYLSVYFGWHYAIDGYASAAMVLGLWAFLGRRDAPTGD